MSVLIDFLAIREGVTMTAVLDAYGIAVAHGKAVCPFHADRNPSLKVYEHGFYCFACGAGGDVIKFIARMDNVSNVEAAKRAAMIGGVMLSQDDYRLRERARRAARERRKVKEQQNALMNEYDRLCAKYRQLTAIAYYGIPFSDEWCEAVRRLPETEGELDELGKRIG